MHDFDTVLRHTVDKVLAITPGTSAVIKGERVVRLTVERPMDDKDYYLIREKRSGTLLSGTGGSAVPKLYKLGDARRVAGMRNARWGDQYEIVPATVTVSDPVR